MNKQIAVGLLVVGALLAVASFAWPTPNPQDVLSTEEYNELEELENQVVDLHLQMQKFDKRSNESISSEAKTGFDGVVAKRDALRNKLESGVKGGGFFRGILRYAGVGLLIAGVGMNMAAKS